MSREEKKAAIEAILFTMGGAVEISRIMNALGLLRGEAEELLLEMQNACEEENRGIRIIRLEDSFQMCTKREYYDILIRIAKQPKKVHLTDTLMETLSIVAYKQPVTKLEIEKIRGVKSDHAVNRLVEYDLVAELGRLDAPGRPILFGTTEQFLRHFGIASVEELPSVDPEKVENFRTEAEEEASVALKI